jgi:hypothetical protein
MFRNGGSSFCNYINFTGCKLCGRRSQEQLTFYNIDGAQVNDCLLFCVAMNNNLVTVGNSFNYCTMWECGSIVSGFANNIKIIQNSLLLKCTAVNVDWTTAYTILDEANTFNNIFTDDTGTSSFYPTTYPPRSFGVYPYTDVVVDPSGITVYTDYDFNLLSTSEARGASYHNRDVGCFQYAGLKLGAE